MANVFKLMNLLTDDEIRMQLALYEAINMGNVFKEAANRLLSGLADVANAFSETFANKTVVDFNYKTTADEVMDRYIKLAGLTREDLLKLNEKYLLEIFKEISLKDYELDPLEDNFTRELVDIAAYSFNINKYKPVGQKIEEIRQAYEKQVLNVLYNQLVSLSGASLTEYAKLMDMSLARLSFENKRALSDAIMPTSFNGKGIILALRKRKDLEKIRLCLNLLGEDAFKMVDADVSLIYSSLKSLARLSRIILARLIYKLAKKTDRHLFYEDVNLPSGKDKDRLAIDKKEDQIFRESLSYHITIQKTIDEFVKKRDMTDNQILKINTEIEELMKGFYEAKEEFDKLDSIKQDYLDKKRPNGDSKQYFNKVNDTKRRMDRFSDMAERKSNKLLELKKKEEELDESIKLENLKLDAAKEKSKKDIEKRAELVMNSWAKRFNKIKFDPKIYENLVVRFSLEERLNIERMLLELDDDNDYYMLKDAYREVNTYIADRKNAIIKMDNYICLDII